MIKPVKARLGKSACYYLSHLRGVSSCMHRISRTRLSWLRAAASAQKSPPPPFASRGAALATILPTLALRAPHQRTPMYQGLL